jgi:hypothetical protein
MFNQEGMLSPELEAEISQAIASFPVRENVKIRGFYRVAIVEESGEMVGDSGYLENLITNDGFNNFLAKALGAISGSSQVTHMALGTGGAPAASDTTLAGEQSVRAAVTAATSSTSKAVVFTATFSSANSFVTATKSISNIGLFATSTAGAATLFAGNTYASSSIATNQNCNATYSLTFA